MQLKPGTLLQSGKYRIVRFINSGGFGCTYEALHTMFDEKVAIKEFFVKDFCNRDESTSHVTVGTQGKKALVEKLKRKFIEEAKVLYKMKHQGIVTVKDIFEENGTAYYVMNYMDRSLSQLIDDKGRLTEAEALRYIRQVSETLKYVHSKGMLHLDIKPVNIMIDEEDNPILIDFGNSKQYDEEFGDGPITLLGIAPGYAPLEQYMQGGVAAFSPETDIYSLGATLYKLVTGITPPGPDEMIYENGINFPKDIHLSENIKGVITYAMQLKRKDRPHSIEEFLKALDGVSQPPVPAQKLKNWIFYVVLAVLLGVAGYLVYDGINRDEKKEAQGSGGETAGILQSYPWQEERSRLG